MKRLIKYGIIREKSEEIKKEINELKEEKKKLLTNIEIIRTSYVGIDAEAMIAAYLEKIPNINKYIYVLEEYNNYFEWISGAYKDTKQKAEKNLNKMPNLQELNIENEVFDLENIYNEGDKNVI